MRIEMRDNFVLDASNSRRTGDGYMVAEPRVARVGIQDYLGSEVGRPDLGKVRIYRSPEEVFSPDSMRSLAFKPITLDHPPVPVNNRNWSKYAKGNTGGEVARDGDYIRVPLMMADEAVIKAVEDGSKVELSCGYSTEYDWTPGVVPDGLPNAGEKYDAAQTNIRFNHVACVGSARGGNKLRVGDADTKACPECGTKMPKNAKECPDCGYEMVKDHSNLNDEGEKYMPKIITVDGVNCEFATDTAAQIVQRAIDNREKELEELRKKKKEQEDALAAALTDAATQKSLVGTKDAELVTVRKQLEDQKPTAAQLDAMVTERAGVVTKARQIMGDKLVVDGKSVLEIRRQVVDAQLGDLSKGWTDDQVAASYASIAAAFGDKGTVPGRAPIPGVTDVARAFSRPGSHQVDASEAAYDAYEKELVGGRNYKAA